MSWQCPACCLSASQVLSKTRWVTEPLCHPGHSRAKHSRSKPLQRRSLRDSAAKGTLSSCRPGWQSTQLLQVNCPYACMYDCPRPWDRCVGHASYISRAKCLLHLFKGHKECFKWAISLRRRGAAGLIHGSNDVYLVVEPAC